MDDLREKLAALCHEQWSHWMKYLFQKSWKRTDEAGAIIPAVLVMRWQRQMQTPYDGLSEEEKESDRREADKFLALMREQEKPWRCDECERVVAEDDLRPVPANTSSLANNLCRSCRERFGWTDEKLDAYWTAFCRHAYGVDNP